MIERFANRIVQKQLDARLIQQQDISVYLYGYTLMLEVLVNIFIAVVLGTIFQSLLTVIIFSFFFIPLRSFAGGWHASKAWICTLFSSILLIINILLIKYDAITMAPPLLTVFYLICVGVVCCLAPQDTKSKRLSDNEKKHYKKIVLFLSSIDIMCFVLFLIVDIASIAEIIFLANASVMCSLILVKVTDRKLKD